MEDWKTLSEGLKGVLENLAIDLTPEKYLELRNLVQQFVHSTDTFESHFNSNRLTGSMKLYETVVKCVKDHLKNVYEESGKCNGEEILGFYHEQWKRFCRGATVIDHLFRPLNRSWVLRMRGEGEKTIYLIYLACLVEWRDHFYDPLSTRLANECLILIDKERSGEPIETSYISSVISSCVEIGIDPQNLNNTKLDYYQKAFENSFIDNTRLFYQAESEKFLAENGIPVYMKRVEKRIQEEERRVQRYLHESTLSPLMKACDSAMIDAHKEPMFEEFEKLLIANQNDDFGRMYYLLARIQGGLDPIRAKFEAFVKKEGLQAIQSIADDAEKANDPQVFVEQLLKVHTKFDQLVVGAFRNENGFVAAFDKACKEFINKNAIAKSPSKSPELLARYSDGLLKKGTKEHDSDMESSLKDVMTIFKYLEEKDVFQRFYSKHLAKRLIYDSSASEDYEENMITKLKDACGFEYTNKLHRMFTDMQTNRDLNTKFKEKFLSEKKFDIGCELSVLVLCSGSWPLSPPNTSFNIPQVLERGITLFQQFYVNQHSGRKLQWLYNICRADVKASYFKHAKTGYIFQVSVYQLAVLLQFQSATSCSFDDLANSTQLPTEILKQLLDIFLKARVLTSSGDVYSLNFDFKSKKLRVNLNVPLKSEQKQEQEETHQHVQEDRKILIQASIVRVMKARKTLLYTNLVSEVIEQLQKRFKPSVSDIKKSIDILIEKEYLERAEGKKDTFNYLA